MEMAVFFLIGIFLIAIFIKVFTWPIKMFLKLVLNGIFGVILLIIANLIGKSFGIYIGINIVTALIAGICGIPGVIFLIIFKLFL